MNSIKRTDQDKLLWTLAQAGIAAYSLWRLWKYRSAHKTPPTAQAVPWPGRTTADAVKEQPGDASPGAPLRAQTADRFAPRPYSDAATHAPTRAMASSPPLQQSYLKSLREVALDAGKEWVAHRAASKGAALALYTLFSLGPMLLLVVAIAGFFFGAERVINLLLEQMNGLMGAQGAEAVETILTYSHQKSDGLLAGLVSAVLVLVGATTAFAELKDSMDELWDVKPSEGSGIWSIVRQRVLSFGLILVLALMLLISLVISTALSAFGDAWSNTSAGGVLATIAKFIGYAVSFSIVTALFAVIFKYLPAVKIAWKDVIVGAVLTAVLFILGKFLIGLYLGQDDSVSMYGAAASVVVLITWVYYSSQIFFYGALFTHEYATKLGSRAQDAAPS